MPFSKSEDFNIFIEFDVKSINSVGPIIKKKIIKENIETNKMLSSSLNLSLIKNNTINGKYEAIKNTPLSKLHNMLSRGNEPRIKITTNEIFFSFKI
tara:strand:+ start:250 stop:540 length:291 start_codon:yes stop_codon:yes gene_type:complete